MAEINDKKVIEFKRLCVNRFNFNLLDADPSDLIDGDMWYANESGDHSLRIRTNGTTKGLDSSTEQTILSASMIQTTVTQDVLSDAQVM